MNYNLSDLRFVIYRRKSSEDDSRQVQSLEGQRAEMQALIERYNLKIVKDIHEARSAKDPGRSGFNEMMNLIESGKANAILCWKADRLARNLIDGGEIIHIMKSHKIKAIVTPHSQFFPEDNVLPLLIEFGMADQYVRDLSNNVRRGMLQKCVQGWFPGVPPIGYANDMTNDVGDRTIKVDSERFDLVNKLWQMLLYEGKSVGEIARLASSQLGLTTLRRRKIGGKIISRSGVYKIFHNPFYAGRFMMNDVWYDGKHKPMITWDEFQRAQEIIKGNNVHGSTKGKDPIRFDLRGALRCGECGCTIVGERKKKKYKSGKVTVYEYYHCSWRKKDYKCGQKSIKADEAGAQLSSLLESVTVPEKYLALALSHLETSRTKERDLRKQEHTVLLRQKDSISRAIEHLSDVYLTSENKGFVILGTEQYMSRKNQYENELRDSRDKIENFDHYQQQSIELTTKTFEFCRRLKKHFQDSTPERKVQILQVLGSNSTLKDGKVSLELKKPFQLIKEGLEGKSDTFEPSLNSPRNVSGGVNNTSCSFWLGMRDYRPFTFPFHFKAW
jgi:DNA invertase Pin-like site-specific DNA recombinase